MKYIYKAKRGPHKVVEGELEAVSREQAIKDLGEMDLVPVRVELKDEIQPSPANTRQSPSVKRREVIIFTRNLSGLLKGNVPILRALVLLGGQARKSGMKKLVEDLTGAVRDGLSLSQAFERHPAIFSPLLVSMVRGGESGGVLGEMMERLALYQEKNEDIRKKIRGALAYPIFILSMGVVTVFVLLTYFMPRLLGVYARNQQDLPLPTEIVLGISNFLSGNWYWVLGIMILIYAFVRRIGNVSSRRQWLDEIKLKVPFVKSLVIKNAVMNFSRTLGLLLEQGVPLFKGVPLAANTVENGVLGSQFGKVEGDLVIKGASLAAALKKIPHFPPMALDMISVGEESGRLGEALSHVSNTYEKEVEGVLKTFTTLMEPALILLIGGVIGFIVFAMLMPVFQLDVMVR